MSNAGAVQAILESETFFNRVRGTVIIEMSRGNGDLFSPTDALDNGATTWTQRHRELIAGVPEFAEDVAYAIATGNENWATDQAVISDLEILSAVQWARSEVKKQQRGQSFLSFKEFRETESRDDYVPAQGITDGDILSRIQPMVQASP